jgi:AraC-like DNA-binding protein
VIHPDNLVHPDLSLSAAEDYPAKVVAYSGTVPKGQHYGWHAHRRAQLFHIVSGAVTVETRRGTFVVPPERAVWIPSRVDHAVAYLQDCSQRFLFFRPEVTRRLPREPAVIRLSPLLRELALAFMTYGREDATSGPAARIAAVILDQLATKPVAPLHLPMPSMERLRRAVTDSVGEPMSSQALSEAAARAALSERSFERHFQADTGVSYRAWRRQARLMKAVQLLSLGKPVGEISDQLGYEAPSAFIASFRRAFGVTPGRYFEESQDG